MKKQPFLRLPDRMKTVQPFTWLVIAYGLVVLLLMLLNGYCKHLETYMDERIYYSMAEGLAKGLGFPTIVGEPYSTQRYLYSLLIAPAFLAGDRLLQFRLIALINALAMCSGAFPVYLLAKDVLKNRRYALLVGVLYLLQPDLQFTGGFMTENLWLPLSLWVIFFSYKLTAETSLNLKQLCGYFFGWLVSSVLLVFVKSSGYVVVIVSGLYMLGTVIVWLTYNLAKRKMKWQQIAFWIVAILAALVSVFLFLRDSAFWKSVQSYIESHIIQEWISQPGVRIRCYLFSLASEILAIGIFPVLFPLCSYRSLGEEGKNLLRLLFLLMVIANLGIVRTSLLIQKNCAFPDFPLYHRYIMYIWLPYCIVFIDALQRNGRISIIAAVVILIGTMFFCYAFQGAVIGSSYEASLLLWARNWMKHRWLWIGLVFVFTAGLLALLLQNRKTRFTALFTAVMLGLQIYNSIYMHWIIRSGYQFSYSKIEEMESFVKENREKTFLVVTIPSTGYEAHLNAKLADTYLLYPNTFFSSDKRILRAETKDGIDLNTGAEAITFKTRLQSVDYVILTTELFIDEEACSFVMGNDYFNIYQLEDSSQIPFIKGFKWGDFGTTVLNPRIHGFYSWYKENEAPTFVSDDVKAHVLYGPFVNLPAGAYEITIHYSYEGDKEGLIAMMDLAGSAFADGEYRKEALADQDSVTISFNIDSECNDFEVRLYAEAAGIKVNSIEVKCWNPDNNETDVLTSVA